MTKQLPWTNEGVVEDILLEALVQVNTTNIHGCRLHSIPGTSYLTAILRKTKVKMKAEFGHV